VLSHHLAHDAGAWTFLGALFAHLKAHRAARALDPLDVFAAPA